MDIGDVILFSLPIFAFIVVSYPFLGPLLLNLGIRHLKAGKKIKANYTASFFVLFYPIVAALLPANLIYNYAPDRDEAAALMTFIVILISCILFTYLAFRFFYGKMSVGMFFWVLLFPLLFSLCLIPFFILALSAPI